MLDVRVSIKMFKTSRFNNGSNYQNLTWFTKINLRHLRRLSLFSPFRICQVSKGRTCPSQTIFVFATGRSSIAAARLANSATVAEVSAKAADFRQREGAINTCLFWLSFFPGSDSIQHLMMIIIFIMINLLSL